MDVEGPAPASPPCNKGLLKHYSPSTRSWKCLDYSQSKGNSTAKYAEPIPFCSPHPQKYQVPMLAPAGSPCPCKCMQQTLNANTRGDEAALSCLCPAQELPTTQHYRALQALARCTALLQALAVALNNQGTFFSASFFFFFWRNDQTGGGDRTSCVKPHPEQASPRFTVNKYSLLAALPSTVTALAPITFQVQTGKQRKASEMADMRFNLLFTAVFIGGALPIRRHCQVPGITPGPSFFLLTFIIVLLWASPQTVLQKKKAVKSAAPTLY